MPPTRSTRGGLPLRLRGGPHRGQPQERYYSKGGGGEDYTGASLTEGEVTAEEDDRVTGRLALCPPQELHLMVVLVPEVHDTEDLGGLGVLDHHHVAL